MFLPVELLICLFHQHHFSQPLKSIYVELSFDFGGPGQDGMERWGHFKWTGSVWGVEAGSCPCAWQQWEGTTVLSLLYLLSNQTGLNNVPRLKLCFTSIKPFLIKKKIRKKETKFICKNFILKLKHGNISCVLYVIEYNQGEKTSKKKGIGSVMGGQNRGEDKNAWKSKYWWQRLYLKFLETWMSDLKHVCERPARLSGRQKWR